MNVIGLDLSLASTGVALPTGDTLTICTRKSQGDLRLSLLRRSVQEIVRTSVVDLVVIEDLPIRAHSAGITGMVHGVVRCTLAELGIPVARIPPATLKAFATGHGNAGKGAMISAACAVADRRFASHDEADAWWLRAAGMDWLGHPVVALPEEQRARLVKGRWPPRSEVPA